MLVQIFLTIIVVASLVLSIYLTPSISDENRIATIGLVISVIMNLYALITNLLLAKSNKKKLKVSAMLGSVINSPTDNPEESKVCITVTNVGQRPVTIKNFTIFCEKKKHFWIHPSPENIYKKLEESDSCTQIINDLSFMEHGLVNIEVHDSTDQIWNTSKKDIRKIKSEYLKYKK